MQTLIHIKISLKKKEQMGIDRRRKRRRRMGERRRRDTQSFIIVNRSVHKEDIVIAKYRRLITEL